MLATLLLLTLTGILFHPALRAEPTRVLAPIPVRIRRPEERYPGRFRS